MFDRGLISLSDELEILLSSKINDIDGVRKIINPDGIARLPTNGGLAAPSALSQVAQGSSASPVQISFPCPTGRPLSHRTCPDRLRAEPCRRGRPGTSFGQACARLSCLRVSPPPWGHFGSPSVRERSEAVESAPHGRFGQLHPNTRGIGHFWTSHLRAVSAKSASTSSAGRPWG